MARRWSSVCVGRSKMRTTAEHLRVFPDRRKEILDSLHAAAGFSWRKVHYWMDEWREAHNLSCPQLGWHANVKNWRNGTVPGFTNAQMLADLYHKYVVSKGMDELTEARIRGLRQRVLKASASLLPYNYHPQVKQLRGMMARALSVPRQDPQRYIKDLGQFLDLTREYLVILDNYRREYGQ